MPEKPELTDFQQQIVNSCWSYMRRTLSINGGDYNWTVPIYDDNLLMVEMRHRYSHYGFRFTDIEYQEDGLVISCRIHLIYPDNSAEYLESLKFRKPRSGISHMHKDKE